MLPTFFMAVGGPMRTHTSAEIQQYAAIPFLVVVMLFKNDNNHFRTPPKSSHIPLFSSSIVFLIVAICFGRLSFSLVP